MSAADGLLDTPEGPARILVAGDPVGAVGTLVLGHGAGGSRWTDDVTAVRSAGVDAGWFVVLVDQPWRVAGRRIAARPESLDRAWSAVLAQLSRPTGPLVLGGRSAGARVACRTAADAGAALVLALSFPLHPPDRPERSRAEELAAPSRAGIPVHVIQGDADPMGSPDEVAAVLPDGAHLQPVSGTHSLERVANEVARSALQGLERAAGCLGSG